MANFMTVSVTCRNEDVQQTLKSIISAHRDFVIKQTRANDIADLVVLELDEYHPERTFAEIQSMLGAAPHAEIMVTTRRTEPQIMLETFRLGVKEFLPQPLSRPDVEEALTRSKNRFMSRTQSNVNLGSVVCVIGGKSGVGTSTIAVNLAVALKDMDSRHSVVLIDLNLHNSDLPLLLDVTAARGLNDLAEDISRLDQAIVQSVLVGHGSGVQLLAGGSQPLQESLTPGCMLYTVNLLRSLFDYIVIDCGHSVTPPVKEALELSARVLMVSCLDVPTMSRTKRMIQNLQHTGVSDTPIAFVINRYLAKHQELLKQAEDALRMKAAWLIPNDYTTACRSLDAGTPLVQLSPKAPVTKEYTRYAAVLIKEFSPDRGSHAGEHNRKGKTGSILDRLWTGFSPNGKAKIEPI